MKEQKAMSHIPTIPEMTIRELRGEINFQKKCIEKDLKDPLANQNCLSMHRSHLKKLESEILYRMKSLRREKL